ncbi:nitric oxide synthase oxygenase [Streptomyces sp. NPDC002004]
MGKSARDDARDSAIDEPGGWLDRAGDEEATASQVSGCPVHRGGAADHHARPRLPRARESSHEPRSATVPRLTHGAIAAAIDGAASPSAGPAEGGRTPAAPGLWAEAVAFITLRHREEKLGDPGPRLAAVWSEIAGTGTYRHTPEELTFGARVAWRNSNRCIGRLYWRSLCVRDRRDATSAEEVVDGCVDHLRQATRDGRIRPVLTVFAPDTPERRGPRIWNEQLIRYAGYPRPDGGVLGDPRNTGITALARRLGWPGGPGTPFDVLPLVVQGTDDKPRWFQLPSDAVLEVPLTHPEYAWWGELALRWHAVPALSGMCLEIGGICYQAAPFNGWYMGTEIGARDLADTDRYDLLPVVAARLGLDTGTDRSLWKDRALVELNRSVLHSFDTAGVTVADHHTESLRFLTHLEREQRGGRTVGADWAWIVPPISGCATPVFHRTYDTVQQRPAFAQHPEALARAHGATDDPLV